MTVSENQLVNQVVFNGNRKIKDDKLQRVVRTQPLGPYSEATVECRYPAIKDAYAAIGRSDVDGDDAGRSDRLKVASISLSSSTKASAPRLPRSISSVTRPIATVACSPSSRPRNPGTFSFLTRKDVYNADKLRADEELLRQFYYNRGYADFQVVSSDAVLDEATNEYTMTITVEEGPALRLWCRHRRIDR